MVTTLDYKDNLQMTDGDYEKHYDSLMSLARLGEGLDWIYQKVATMERDLRSKALKDEVSLAVVGGLLDFIPIGITSCAFQWYALTACNYAQLVGWLIFKNSDLAKKYVRRVIPRLVDFRNKVAAHPAITDPRNENEADLLASVMTHIVFVKGYLLAGSISPILLNDNGNIEVSINYSWSLTRTHKHLISRYWPEGIPKSYQSLQIPANSTVSIKVDFSDIP